MLHTKQIKLMANDDSKNKKNYANISTSFFSVVVLVHATLTHHQSSLTHTPFLALARGLRSERRPHSLEASLTPSSLHR